MKNLDFSHGKFVLAPKFWVCSRMENSVKNEYYYEIYGLKVTSQIEFPEAYRVDGMEEEEIEVNISLSDLLDEYQKLKLEGRLYKMEKDVLWFFMEGVGDFVIRNGHEILVNPQEGYDKKNLRAMVLGTCFGTLLIQRQILAIHGSAVVSHNRAIIICGQSGSGKSTLTTQLRKKGFQFMADDTVALRSVEGCIYACPAYPQQKLCKDAALHFGYSLDQLLLLEEDRQKYAIRLNHDYCSKKMILGCIVEICAEDCDKVELEVLQGHDKLESFVTNLYHYTTYRNIGMDSSIFKQCIKIVQDIPIYRIHRPKSKQTMEEQLSLVLQLISK